MVKRITKKFVQTRMGTATKNLRSTNVLAPDESLRWDSTGSERFPYRLQICSTTPEGSHRVRADLTANVSWASLNAAVDALYELSWVGLR